MQLCFSLRSAATPFFIVCRSSFQKTNAWAAEKKETLSAKNFVKNEFWLQKKTLLSCFRCWKNKVHGFCTRSFFLCTNGSKKNFFLEHRNSLSFFFSNQSFGIISFKMGLKRFSLWTFFSKNWNARGLSKIKNNSWQKVRLSEAPYPRPAPANQPYLGNLIDPRKLFWKVFVFFRFAKKKQNILWDNFYKEFFFINL